MATNLATPAVTGKKDAQFVIVRGRSYTLFKRGDKRGSPWWYRVQVNGKRVAVSTETADLGLAKDRAKIGIVDALDGRMHRTEEHVTKRKDVPTIGQILDFGNDGHLSVRKATANLYERSLILIVETVKGINKAQVRKQKIDVLTSELARAYQAKKSDKPLHLIPATSPTARHDRIYRDHNEWLRRFIPDRQKGAHELRKHFGSVWATKTGSLYVAAQMLRVSLVVAEYHYSALLKRPQPLTLEDYRM